MEIIRNIVIVTSHCEGENNNLTTRRSGAPGTTSPARNNFIGGSLSMVAVSPWWQSLHENTSSAWQQSQPHVMPSGRDRRRW